MDGITQRNKWMESGISSSADMATRILKAAGGEKKMVAVMLLFVATEVFWECTWMGFLFTPHMAQPLFKQANKQAYAIQGEHAEAWKMRLLN